MLLEDLLEKLYNLECDNILSQVVVHLKDARDDFYVSLLS